MTSSTRACEHTYPHLPHKQWRGMDGGMTRCPGVKVPASSRLFKPATRRMVLTDLRAVHRWISYLITDWNVDSRVYRSGVAERPRRVDEYPENSTAAWGKLHADLDTAIASLSALREQVERGWLVAQARDRMK